MDFPLFAPIDSEGQTYRGFLPVHDKEYLIQVQLGNGQEPPVIYGEPSLRRRLLGSDADKTQRRLIQCGTAINPLLSELKAILEEAQLPISSTAAAAAQAGSSSTATALMTELMAVGFDKIRAMNDTMDEVDFVLTDSKGRAFDIRASVPPGYPLAPAKITVDLPEQVPPSASSFTEALKACQKTIGKYQVLFDCLDELDGHVRVLDPDKPTYKDAWRRVALINHCSLHIELHPDRPMDAPKTVRFFGSDKNTKSMRDRWQQSVWDEKKTPYQNIASMVGDALVSCTREGDADKNEVEGSADIECGICYTYKLVHEKHGQQHPDVICTNDQCNRGFHPTCLYEWLRSNPSTTRSFNVLFGNCPYCNEKITIKAIL